MIRLASYLASTWGAYVVPCNATHRFMHGGLADATRDLDRIVQLWARTPEADVAVALAPSRLAVLDVDAKHGVDGRDTIHELEQRLGPLPATPRISTPHNGEHYWLRVPAGIEIRSSVAKLGAAVDVRASGVGFASGKGRDWFLDARPSEIPLAELPAAWVTAIQRLDSVRGEYGEPFRLPDEIEKGTRNDVLFRYACSMHARAVEWTLLGSAVVTANQKRCQPPLHDREVVAILRSVEGYPVGLGRRAA